MDKPKSIFDLLDDVCFKKVPWEEQSQVEQKKFQPYMIHRFLSMNLDYLDLIAECLPLTSNLNGELTYKFYLDLLPKKKSYAKYIGNKADKEGKSHQKVIEFMAQKLRISENEAEEYLGITFELPDGYSNLVEWIKMYGYNDKQINKEFGL